MQQPRRRKFAQRGRENQSGKSATEADGEKGRQRERERDAKQVLGSRVQRGNRPPRTHSPRMLSAPCGWFINRLKHQCWKKRDAFLDGQRAICVEQRESPNRFVVPSVGAAWAASHGKCATLGAAAACSCARHVRRRCRGRCLVNMT
ncbi:hypothetical protein MRX96_037632 [Rhipicephalus microplus]